MAVIINVPKADTERQEKTSSGWQFLFCDWLLPVVLVILCKESHQYYQGTQEEVVTRRTAGRHDGVPAILALEAQKEIETQLTQKVPI